MKVIEAINRNYQQREQLKLEIVENITGLNILELKNKCKDNNLEDSSSNEDDIFEENDEFNSDEPV
jgi:hypothetical protein